MRTVITTTVLGLLLVTSFFTFVDAQSDDDVKTWQKAKSNKDQIDSFVAWCSTNMNEYYDKCTDWIKKYVENTEKLIQEANLMVLENKIK